jgi:GNAT superfamily N-acetyltransferase
MWTMRVQLATQQDIPAWLSLAAEVEPLFGPMVNDPHFHQALSRNIGRGSAFCVREHDGPPGSPLIGGLLFSAHPPLYKIGWLAVAERWRGHGAGQVLVTHVLTLVQPPAEVVVTTFSKDMPEGEPARRFYVKMGFQPAESCSGPYGSTRQIFRRVIGKHNPPVHSEQSQCSEMIDKG